MFFRVRVRQEVGFKRLTDNVFVVSATGKTELLPNDSPTHVVYAVLHVVALNLRVHVCVYARQARLVGTELLKL